MLKKKIKFPIIIVLLILNLLPLFAQNEKVKSKWNGCDRYDFTFMGQQAIIVVPDKIAKGKPWIWRPAFFDAFPAVDKALLKKGFHIAYYDLTHFYGSPHSVKLGNAFYEKLINEYDLSNKVTLEGFSRGGFLTLNWAAVNPEKVACIYLDAPVCDINSWPGKKRTKLWNDFLEEWNLPNEFSGESFKGNALQLVPKLVTKNIPIICVCGDCDKTVPFEDNFKLFFEKYRENGGVVELILKPNCDHHPHSLSNPESIVDFILRYQKGYTDYQYINRRGNLSNSFSKFHKEKKGCVAFLGGSITYMKGWKDQIKCSLKQRFPETQFKFIDAGISSTGSTPHAFRLENDILKNSIPDLLFFEAAVNDDSNGFSAEEQIRGMEGIVRHMLKVNPKVDMIMLHFIAGQFFPYLDKNIIPDVIMNHERVANWYSISSINLALEIHKRINNGLFSWKDFGGVHPCWEGSKYYSATINRLFDIEINHKSHTQNTKPHTIPKALDFYSYENGRFISINNAYNKNGFKIIEKWKPVDKNIELRPGFYNIPMLEAVTTGASLQLDFKGKAIGIFCVAGPKAGILEYSIDNGPTHTLNLFTPWSRNIYLPWLYTLYTELKDGPHTLKLKLKEGEECQIRNFVAN